MGRKFNQRFYQMGFDSSQPVINLGQSGFFLFLTLLWMCFVLFIPLVCRLKSKPCDKLRSKAKVWKQKLFWNGWIRLFIEIY
jgi:hypothetical protein